jgi:hypothetical protein
VIPGDLKKLLGRLLLLLPIPLFMAGVTGTVDPAELFHDSSAQLAEQWARKGSVSIQGNIDERRLQDQMIRRAPPAVDGIILGSSRAMEIRSGWFPGRCVLNLSVSGASVEDHLALHELVLARGIRPRLVVLSLDPWLLNRNSGQDRWKSIAQPYELALRRLGAPAESLQGATMTELLKWRQLVSPSYFQESLKRLWRSMKKGGKEEDFTRRLGKDGSTYYPREFTSASVEQVRDLAGQYIGLRGVYALEGFSELDARAGSLMESFAKSLRSQGTQMLFVLPPYHPRVYSFLSSTELYRHVGAAEQWFRALAGREGIRVIGSYDPAACGFTEADFLDGMHARESALARLVASGK